MHRALVGVLVGVALLGGSTFAKKGRGDGGSFLVRAPHAMATIASDHPSYVSARRSLWSCWQNARPCTVTLTFEFSDNDEVRQDALLEVAPDGTRSITFREEHWSRDFSNLGTEITPSGTRDRLPRRFLQLERIPIDGLLTGAALPDSDTTGPERWRLRFSDEKPMAGATLHVESRTTRDQPVVW